MEPPVGRGVAEPRSARLRSPRRAGRGHDVGLRLPDDLEQLLLLPRRHLELRERLLELAHHHVPLLLRDVHASVRLLHALPRVLARTARHLAHHRGHLVLEIRRGRPLAARVDLGVPVQGLVRDQAVDEVVHDRSDPLQSSEPLVERAGGLVGGAGGLRLGAARGCRRGDAGRGDEVTDPYLEHVLTSSLRVASNELAELRALGCRSIKSGDGGGAAPDPPSDLHRSNQAVLSLWRNRARSRSMSSRIGGVTCLSRWYTANRPRRTSSCWTRTSTRRPVSMPSVTARADTKAYPSPASAARTIASGDGSSKAGTSSTPRLASARSTAVRVALPGSRATRSQRARSPGRTRLVLPISAGAATAMIRSSPSSVSKSSSCVGRKPQTPRSKSFATASASMRLELAEAPPSSGLTEQHCAPPASRRACVRIPWYRGWPKRPDRRRGHRGRAARRRRCGGYALHERVARWRAAVLGEHPEREHMTRVEREPEHAPQPLTYSWPGHGA